jgi:hypothetical protein
MQDPPATAGGTDFTTTIKPLAMQDPPANAGGTDFITEQTAPIPRLTVNTLEYRSLSS